MKIVKVEDLHCDAGWRDFSFLKITTDDGIVGWSEYNESYGSAGLTAVIRRLAQSLIGADPRPVVLEREYGVDPAYQRLFVVPAEWLAKLAVGNDRDVIGAYVRATGRAGVLASQGFRKLQTGNVQTYLTAAVVGAVALAILAGVIGS